ncbi:WYL domain-containing protein [Burkholderia cenocepacia]|uniref:WYL domain-containing protein n=1 Tax=Burkholderia cenocepacia TaxID=95486 RepID=UPI0021AB4149|nr:WYL domain-containing protein [Burkholderia cenocepacia]
MSPARQVAGAAVANEPAHCSTGEAQRSGAFRTTTPIGLRVRPRSDHPLPRSEQFGPGSVPRRAKIIVPHTDKNRIKGDSNMKFHHQLIDAIQKRHVLELRYDGYSRVVEPYAYGVNHDGHYLLRCYQTGGGSQSGNRIGWKLLLTNEIDSLHENGSLFQTAQPGYKRNDPAMQRIYAQI